MFAAPSRPRPRPIGIALYTRMNAVPAAASFRIPQRSQPVRALKSGPFANGKDVSIFGPISMLEPALRHLIAAGCVTDRAPLRGSKSPMKAATTEEAVEIVANGDRCFVQCAANTPNALLWGLYTGHRHRLSNVELVHILTNVRALIDYDTNDYVPTFMQDCAHSLSEDRPVNVALVQVSPPDVNGWCNLGCTPSLAAAAVRAAEKIIAIINPRVPRIGGETALHMSMIDRYFELETPLNPVRHPTSSSIEDAIGRNIASMVEDGATLQVGVGAAPEAALAALRSHKDLGVHTELLSDGLCDLMKRGVVNNSKKVIRPGKTVTGFVYATQECYDWVDRNSDVEAYGVDFVNNPTVIALNPKVIAINSATQVDLTGQVCADSIGHRIISGVGGQMDFMLGALHSKGGKAIIAITSRCPKGTSRIVSALPAGAGVVTSRPNVGYIVTEFGIAQMVGRSLHERAAALIRIAHPDDRERLEREWFESHKKMEAGKSKTQQ